VEIRAARAAQARRARVSARGVLREICSIAFSDAVDLVNEDGSLRPLRQVPLDARRAVASVRVKQERVTTRTTGKGKTKTKTTTHEKVVEYKLWDKLGALEKLCRYLGLRTEIPPLEALLLALPRSMAAEIRAAMIQARRTAPEGGQAPGSESWTPHPAIGVGKTNP
jgi:hypothetical protein